MAAELNTAGQNEEAAQALNEGADEAGHELMEHIAFNAYALAEAMIRERNRLIAQETSNA